MICALCLAVCLLVLEAAWPPLAPLMHGCSAAQKLGVIVVLDGRLRNICQCLLFMSPISPPMLRALCSVLSCVVGRKSYARTAPTAPRLFAGPTSAPSQGGETAFAPGREGPIPP